MADLSFFVEAEVKGAGKERGGTLSIGHEVPYSVPASMGGKGEGASPETLLIGAVTACYSLTLLAFLQRKKLPHSEVVVKTEGVVTGFPQKEVFARIVVHPTIRGGRPEVYKDYREAAVQAREQCFIGQTVAAGGVVYELGAVAVE